MKSGVQANMRWWPGRRARLAAGRYAGSPIAREGFLSDEQAREMRITVELGLDPSTNSPRLRLRWDANLGAYVTGRSGWPVGNIGGTAGVYHIPTMYAEAFGILTNTVPTAAYRGAGRPEATYTIERIIDIAARELGISPYELRRINLIPPDAMPYKTALTFTYDCGEFEGNMQKASEMAETRRFRGAARRGRRRAAGCAASACATASKSPAVRSCVRRRIRRPCAWPRMARWCCDPARCRWGRGWRRRSASWSPSGSACHSTTCTTRRVTPTCCRAARAMAARVRCASADRRSASRSTM